MSEPGEGLEGGLKKGSLDWIKKSPPEEILKFLQEKEKEIQEKDRNIHSLTVDSTTNLLKKEGFIDKFRKDDQNIKEITDGSFAVLQLDLDDLKSINDQYSHEKGDLYLSLVAKEIDRLAWGEGDNVGLAFRGKHGDEFVALLKLDGGDQDAYRKRVELFSRELDKALEIVGEKLVEEGIDRRHPKVSCGSVFVGSLVSEDKDKRLDQIFSFIDDEAEIAIKFAKSKKDSTKRLSNLVLYEDTYEGIEEIVKNG